MSTLQPVELVVHLTVSAKGRILPKRFLLDQYYPDNGGRICIERQLPDGPYALASTGQTNFDELTTAEDVEQPKAPGVLSLATVGSLFDHLNYSPDHRRPLTSSELEELCDPVWAVVYDYWFKFWLEFPQFLVEKSIVLDEALALTFDFFVSSNYYLTRSPIMKSCNAVDERLRNHGLQLPIQSNPEALRYAFDAWAEK